MADDLVEEVARAICLEDGLNPDDTKCGLLIRDREGFRPHWEGYEEHARAAIAVWSRPMTADIDTARMRELLAKATPGPWKAWDRGIGWEVHDENDIEINSEFRETFREGDAALIVALRNAAPALLDTIVALRAENAALVHDIARRVDLETDLLNQSLAQAKTIDAQAARIAALEGALREIVLAVSATQMRDTAYKALEAK